MRPLRSSVAALCCFVFASATYAQTPAPAPTPSTLQTQNNALPWAGQRTVTGPAIQNLFSTTQSIFVGMGTWDVNGVYTPTIGGAAFATVAASGKFTDLTNLPVFAGDVTCSYSNGVYSCTVAKVNGQVLAAVATSGSATDLLNILPVAHGGTGLASFPTGVLKGASGGLTTATAGIDYLTPSSPAGGDASGTLGALTVNKLNGQTPAQVATSGSAANISVPAFQSAPTNLVLWLQGICASWDGAGCHPANALAPTGAGDSVTTLGRQLSAHFQDVVSVLDAPYSAKCDMNPGTGIGTDDTSALQAAINAVQATGTTNGVARATLWIPRSCLTGPLTITRPIRIVGNGKASAMLRLKAGSTAPLFTIAVAYDTNDYYAGGNAPAQVSLEGMTLASGNNADVPGQGVAHGIQLTQATTNPVYTHVTLQDLVFTHLPADGLNATGFGSKGFVTGNRLYFIGNGRDNLSTNSNYDWRLNTVDMSEAVRDNFALSGGGGINCIGCNMYTAGRYNLNAYNAQSNTGPHIFIGGAIDTAAQHGVFFNYSGTGTPLIFQGTNFANNGVSASNTYSDIDVYAGSSSSLILNGTAFAAPYAANNADNSKFNINFESTTNQVVANNVWTGASSAAQAFSASGQVYGSYSLNGALPIMAAGSINVTSGQIYTGYKLTNAAGLTVASIAGYSSTDDVGVMSVLSNNAIVCQISASNAFAINFCNQDFYLGNSNVNAAPNGRTLRATGGSGTNVGGASLGLAGGQGTGSASGGSINLTAYPAGAPGSAPNTAGVTTAIDGTTGALTIPKLAADPAQGPGLGKSFFYTTQGTTGTCSLKLLSGTSTTPVVISANAGSGC